MSGDRRDLPELPSDEELGIAGMEEEGATAPATSAAGARVRTPVKPPAPPGAPPRRGRGAGAPVVPGGGRGWVAALVTAGVLVAGVWGASPDRTLPRTVPANAPDSLFSSGRALSQLVELARAPRPVGAPEHTRVRELIVERLGELGLEPEVLTSTWVDRRAQGVRAVTVRNIIARIPGAESTGALLVTAHYDAVPLSHGAGDAGTGVAAVLETLRALQAGPRLRNDVIVLITDAEELGLIGARTFVQTHPWLDDVRAVLSVEMRGGGGPAVMFETGRENGWIVRALERGDPAPAAYSLSLEVYRRLPNDTDFSPFRDAGIQGVNSAAIGRSWMYHQATDIATNLQESTLQQHGERLLGMTRWLGVASLENVHAPDRAYATVPVLGMFSYDARLAPMIGIGVLGLWIVAVLLVVARGAGGMAVAMGALLALVAISIAAAAGAALMLWLPAFHPEFGVMTPAFYGEGWYMAALAAFALAAVAGVYHLAWPRFGWPGLAVGGLGVPVLIGAAVGVVAPLASISFQLPALAGVVAALVVAVATPRRRAKRGDAMPPIDHLALRAERAHPLAWGVALLLALVVLVFLVPVIELFWIAMSLRLAALLGALVVVALLCMMPALGALPAPQRGWAPVLALVVGAMLVGVGVLRAGASPERPAPSTLVYAFDRESGAALWASRPDAGLAWAEEQVGALPDTQALEAFHWPGTQYRTGPAPASVAPLPVVRVDGVLPDGRVRVAVTSAAGAEIVTVSVADGEAAFVGVQGRGLPTTVAGPGGGRPITRLTHQGVPEGGALLLDLEPRPGAPFLMIEIVEEHLRPGEIIGPGPFQRPAGLMPAAWTRSDRALIRTTARIEINL